MIWQKALFVHCVRRGTEKMWLKRCGDELELSLSAPQKCITLSMKEGMEQDVVWLHLTQVRSNSEIRSRHTDEGFGLGTRQVIYVTWQEYVSGLN